MCSTTFAALVVLCKVMRIEIDVVEKCILAKKVALQIVVQVCLLFAVWFSLFRIASHSPMMSDPSSFILV